MQRNAIKTDRTECPKCGHKHPVQQLWDYFDASFAEWSVMYRCMSCDQKIKMEVNVNGFLVLRNDRPRKKPSILQPESC